MCRQKRSTIAKEKQIARSSALVLGDGRYRARSAFATISGRSRPIDRSAEIVSARSGFRRSKADARGASEFSAVDPRRRFHRRCTRRRIPGRRFGESTKGKMNEPARALSAAKRAASIRNCHTHPRRADRESRLRRKSISPGGNKRASIIANDTLLMPVVISSRLSR